MRSGINPASLLPDRLSNWSAIDLLSLVIALGASLFVFTQMRPDLLFADTTPSGGDMGAHVWGPAFLRDHLLGQGRLAGWTPDWYAGFPAYQFYMVIPSLAIVAINGGLRPLIGIPIVLIILGAAYVLTKESDHKVRYRVLAVVVAVLLLSVPYGISFKLVSVSGLVMFPLAAWAMGRLARAPEPVPAFLPIGALFFLFDTNFTIYGGNIASTLAGEFAFSISLSITLLAIGVTIRGMDTGRWRAPAAIIISLIALTHLIPVFFAVTALVVLVVLGPTVPKMWPIAVALALALVPIAFADGTSRSVSLLAVFAALVVLLAVIVAEPEVKKRSIWLLITGPSAALLAGFWLLPFYFREPFFNDMGWERLDEVGPAMLTVPMKVALPVAAIGTLAALAARERIGILFASTGLVFAAAVANLGDGPLWNARLLPFYYLSIYFVAVVGAALVIRYAAIAISEDFARPDRRVTIAGSIVAFVVGLIAVALPLQILPGGSDQADGSHKWLAFSSHARSFIPSWTAWNYSGYERKPAYREYHDIVAAMGGVGEVKGCGRAMWEYSKDLDRYGTPMALMLLPHWTDGCIGSMEGLYFESSSTTPFHFLNQSTLSESPSRAQRDLPYQSFDINRGVGQLQIMGVRYYMAQSDEAIEAARSQPDLVEVVEAQPFVIFEVAGSELVQALSSEPVVIDGRDPDDYGEEATRFDKGWLSQAVAFYNNPAGFDTLPAEDGPDDWLRVEALLPGDGRAVSEPPEVTITTAADQTSKISFSVDKVGTPVLVKASFFPNWKADGADGPWRVGPNMMVVVPTETDVTLSYGRTALDWLGVLATLLGVVAVVGLTGVDRQRWLRAQAAEVWGDDDQSWDGELADLLHPSAEATSTGVHPNRPPTPEPVLVDERLVETPMAPGFEEPALPGFLGDESVGDQVGVGGLAGDTSMSSGPIGTESMGAEMMGTDLVGDELAAATNGERPEPVMSTDEDGDLAPGPASVEITLSTEVNSESQPPS